MGQSAEPHCMNCSKPFTRLFLKHMLGITFMKTTFKDKRKELLFELEKSKIPATMGSAERYNKCIDLRKGVSSLHKDLISLRVQCTKIQEHINNKNSQIWRLESGCSDAEKKKKREYIHPCLDENCNGFMSSQWKCGICKKFGCHLCHEVIGMRKDDPHECDENTIKTVAAIKNDTHPCPKCYAPIFKISGCDQMWCTQCEVAFSWKTGEIQRGNVHNPHFYEARRRLGINTRNPGDVVCGGLISAWQFRQCLEKHCHAAGLRNYISIQPNMSPASRLFHLIYAVLHRSVRHNIHMLDGLRADVRYLQSTERLRVRFIVGESDKDTFKKEVYRTNEKMNKKRRLCDIFETFINVTVENVNAMGVDLNTSETEKEAFEKVMKLYIECEKIRKYTECEFLKIGSEYRQATYIFEPKGELIYARIPLVLYVSDIDITPWESLDIHIAKMEKETYAESAMHKLFTESPIGIELLKAQRDVRCSLQDGMNLEEFTNGQVFCGAGGGGAAAPNTSQ